MRRCDLRWRRPSARRQRHRNGRGDLAIGAGHGDRRAGRDERSAPRRPRARATPISAVARHRRRPALKVVVGRGGGPPRRPFGRRLRDRARPGRADRRRHPRDRQARGPAFHSAEAPVRDDPRRLLGRRGLRRPRDRAAPGSMAGITCGELLPGGAADAVDETSKVAGAEHLRDERAATLEVSGHRQAISGTCRADAILARRTNVRRTSGRSRAPSRAARRVASGPSERRATRRSR